MKKRFFPHGDNKNRSGGSSNMWNSIFSNMAFSEYIETLNYDDVSIYMKELMGHMDRDALVLDLGCGGGRHVYLLSQMGFTGLFGMDLSMDGLRIASQNVRGLRVSNGDACALPFGDNTFDVVFLVGIVYEIEERDKHLAVFREIHRVLKKGGRLFFVNNSPYNVGERIFTVTNWFRFGKSKGESFFFVWRFCKRDVKRLVKVSGMKIISNYKCNFGMNLFRFFFGVFVKRVVRENRRKNIHAINPYSVHEHYIANRDSTLFNRIGRMIFMNGALFRGIFYNTEIYVIEK